ncbi:unnamed protein product, partial [Ectocarpus fasciculatus]
MAHPPAAPWNRAAAAHRRSAGGGPTADTHAYADTTADSDAQPLDVVVAQRSSGGLGVEDAARDGAVEGGAGLLPRSRRGRGGGYRGPHHRRGGRRAGRATDGGRVHARQPAAGGAEKKGRGRRRAG